LLIAASFLTSLGTIPFGVAVIGCVLVPHELEEDIAVVIPCDPAKEVEEMFFLTHLGDCPCIRLCVGSVVVIRGWP
jgi:hypothetical protein